ncbi:MAG: hypothetical protein GEU76_06930 [Alphaproteobacteria bacterium]|nr:hypothetical protein [Alphaproteobacteria bacterium]
MPLKPETNDEVVEARRRFLLACGKFAVATPPAMALMLADAKRNYAMASNNGFGNGGGDGVPGNSGSNSSPNAPQKSADEVR